MWLKDEIAAIVVKVVAFGIASMQLYSVFYGIPSVLVHRITFVIGILLIVFFSPRWRLQHPVGKVIDSFFIISLLVAGFYFITNNQRIVNRISFVDPLTKWDIVIGIIVVVALVECTRRLCGAGLTVVVIVFISYAFYGRLPGILNHKGVSFSNFMETQMFSGNGIFGIPIGAVVGFVFYFLLFAAFLEETGGGKLFIDLALRIFGRMRGGAAKAAVIGSGAMGTVSGVAVANVIATGTFTIPLMKKTGFDKEFAGAVEAAASTGGQIMPPIMGAGAFVLAEMTGISYSMVIVHAVIPAVLYYLAIYFMVDLKARADGIASLNKTELPPLSDIYKKIHLLIPLVVLIYFIFSGFSLMMACIRGTLVIFLLSLIRRETRMSLKSIIDALISSAEKMPMVAVPCAAAGAIVGVVVFTGLGVKFTSLLVSISGAGLFVSLILVAVGCIILGMGMPTTAAYIMVAILMAPAVIELGVTKAAAHLFIFYFAILSMVTPPVAIATYAAAGLADANATKTGWRALQLTAAGFIVPFSFAYNPALILQGPIGLIIWVICTSVIGIYALAGANIGYYFVKTTWWERLIGAVSALCLLSPSRAVDIAGFIGMVVVLLFQLTRAKKEQQIAPIKG